MLFRPEEWTETYTSTRILETMTDTWRPVDPLGEALHFLRMSGIFYCRSEFTAPWGLALPPIKDCMMFHVVTAGECWLEVEGARRLPAAAWRSRAGAAWRRPRLVSEAGVPAAKLFDLPRELVSERYEILRHGGGGAPTTVICGVVRFDHPAAHQLVRLLPRLISVDAWSSPEMEWMQSTLRFIAAEARELRAGGETVITRLADILVIQAIRSWIARDAAAQSGWLGALRDKQIGRAIALIHRDPARNWTLASLASDGRHVALGVCGALHAARRRTGDALRGAMENARRAEVAQRGWRTDRELAIELGYESEAAFSRAFKRFIGVSPGAVRRRDRPERQGSDARVITAHPHR